MKAYIGDSVYAELPGDGTVILTTENGMGPSNKIVLEAFVFINLLRAVGENKTANDETRFIQRLHGQ
jgi:hypothetical protein